MNRPLACCLTAACLIVSIPATGLATPPIGEKQNGFSLADERYLETWLECWKEFKTQCGRNLVDDGLSSGEPPSEQRVKESTATMQRWLSPPEPTVAVADSDYAAPATSTVAPSSGLEAIAQCESGGDYGAVNSSSGAYGRYQIMPSTSAAYGCDMSSPAGQDACAQEIYAAEGSSAWVC